MELPLDHFRLIGVSPSATSEEILRAFQLRLDKSPDDGFTYEVLVQRSELLRLTADLLTNSENRKKYEDLVLKGVAGLEFPSNREVAGLILLWEAGYPKEAFKLTRQTLQPPQTPALGSSREADLTLLAALTSRDAAIKEQDQRCYANAADFLQEGIQILQRMGKMGELRKNLEDDLSALLPYRILDYLSRDISDVETHKKGVNMLFNYICKRGGLEGNNKSENEEILDQKNFELFFQQVKSFLTVQEQIELFLNLQKRGSTEATFLAFKALTAEGYAKRKPEKLNEAKKIIKNLNASEFDTFPLMGCIELLLANVEQAEEKFLRSTDDNLKEWLDSYKGEKLDAICLYCKNWLENEVLRDFRDIEIKEVDLDSWFEHIDILKFIEKEEQKASKVISSTYIQKLGNNLKKFIDESKDDRNQSYDKSDSSDLPFPGGNKITKNYYSNTFSQKDFIKDKSIKIIKRVNERYSELKFLIGDLIKNNQFLNKPNNFIYLNVFLILFVLGIGISFARNNNKNNLIKNSSSKVFIPKNEKMDLKIETKFEKPSIKEVKSNSNSDQFIVNNGLTAKSPNLQQIRNLIEIWYLNKSRFLSGGEEPNLSKFVKKDLINRLYEERNSDIKNNLVKNIATEIKNIEFISQSSSRISVLINLIYTEEIVPGDQNNISKTSYPLEVKYILGFSDKSWKLVDFVSGR